MKKYKYSEIFGRTIQGEGLYTGRPTVWIRFWGCNFSCNGFGQDNPSDPATYSLPYQTIDISSIKKMEDLPVFKKSCDSSYSWSQKFSHLAHNDTVHEICNKLENFLKSESNPEGKFLHPVSEQWTHMAFTGGEPMISQNAIVDIMEEFESRDNLPKFVTIETNGTQKIREKFLNGFAGPHGFIEKGTELFWSVSPKLYLSGEKWEDAILPNIVDQYNKVSSKGQLKYVSNGSDRSWKEVVDATKLYRDKGIDWEVWIMPVGADIEGQNLVAAKVTEGAVERGYNVAARVHTYIFGNIIGR
jgi:organic radical activating enzyme